MEPPPTSPFVTRLEFVVREALFDLIPGVTFEYNYRPAWLGKRELDIYIPELKTAIEVDGLSHSHPAIQKKDKLKDRAALKKGVKILRVRSAQDVWDLGKLLKKEFPECVTGKIEDDTHKQIRAYLHASNRGKWAGKKSLMADLNRQYGSGKKKAKKKRTKSKGSFTSAKKDLSSSGRPSIRAANYGLTWKKIRGDKLRNKPMSSKRPGDELAAAMGMVPTERVPPLASRILDGDFD